jgi:hypothetical protein
VLRTSIAAVRTRHADPTPTPPRAHTAITTAKSANLASGFGFSLASSGETSRAQPGSTPARRIWTAVCALVRSVPYRAFLYRRTPVYRPHVLPAAPIGCADVCELLPSATPDHNDERSVQFTTRSLRNVWRQGASMAPFVRDLGEQRHGKLDRRGASLHLAAGRVAVAHEAVTISQHTT